MQYTLKTFGITREIVGAHEIRFEMEGKNVSELKNALMSQFPDMKLLKSIMIAVNNVYAADDLELVETDEIALIPPVSGG